MSVNVKHNCFDYEFPHGGHTIRHVMKLLRDVLNVSEPILAFVNGNEVPLDNVLNDGDRLEFTRAFGQKGGHPDYFSEEEVVGLVGREGLQRLQKDGITPVQKFVYDKNSINYWIRQTLEVEGVGTESILEMRVSASELEVDPGTLSATKGKSKSVFSSKLQFSLLHRIVQRYDTGRKHNFLDLKLSVWGNDMTSNDAVRKAIKRLEAKLRSDGLIGVNFDTTLPGFVELILR